MFSLSVFVLELENINQYTLTLILTHIPAGHTNTHTQVTTAILGPPLTLRPLNIFSHSTSYYKQWGLHEPVA